MPPSHPPSLLISTSSPARPLPSSSHHNPSQSPFRYVQLQDLAPDTDLSSPPPPSPPPPPSSSIDDHPLSGPSRCIVASSPSPVSGKHLHTYPALRADSLPQPRGRPHGIRIPDRLKPWLGIGSWAVTSIGFLLAIAFWKKEVFTGMSSLRSHAVSYIPYTGLDQLSLHLQSLGNQGYAILFCLIFITTIRESFFFFSLLPD